MKEVELRHRLGNWTKLKKLVFFEGRNAKKIPPESIA